MHRPTQVWVRLVLLLAKRLGHYAPLDYDGGMIIIVNYLVLLCTGSTLGFEIIICSYRVKSGIVSMATIMSTHPAG